MNAVTSHDFPLYSSQRSSQKPLSLGSHSKRINENIRYGFNSESPQFFHLPKLTENKITSIKQYNIINKPKSNLEKENISINCFENPIETQNLRNGSPKLKPIFRNSLSESQEIPSNSQFKIHPLLNKHEKSSLININDYNIKESYQVNKERFESLNRRSVEEFNCILNNKKTMKLLPLQRDKCAIFYENYLYLSNKPQGFKKNKGVFTEMIDNNKINEILKLKPSIYGKNKKTENKSSDSSKDNSIELKDMDYRSGIDYHEIEFNCKNTNRRRNKTENESKNHSKILTNNSLAISHMSKENGIIKKLLSNKKKDEESGNLKKAIEIANNKNLTRIISLLEKY